jgi:hypothetical protein
MSRSIKLFHDFMCQIYKIYTPPPNKTVKAMLIQTWDVWGLSHMSSMVADLIDRINHNYHEYQNNLRDWNTKNVGPVPTEQSTLIIEYCAGKTGTATSAHLEFLSHILQLLNADITTMKKEATDNNLASFELCTFRKCKKLFF